MTDQKCWYAGVDWASESHLVRLTDAEGRKIGERKFEHSGEGLGRHGGLADDDERSVASQPRCVASVSATRPRGRGTDGAQLRGSRHQPEADGSLP